MIKEMIVPINVVVSRIKTIVSNIEVHKVWIQGEVSNLTKHRSGHYYFSIKDEKAELSCVMFASYVNKLNFTLEEGMKVLLKGSLNVFEQRGSLQLYVREMRLDGIGNLFQEFERRKKMLFEAGYFDEAHKKAKPEVIERIGLIAGSESAAMYDVLSTIQKRWPMLQVILFPSYVQGAQAPASLIRQIKKADALGLDALLVVRGGGSFEDLFCFNDVDLVKTIYACKTYVVSGVGHEVDTTLCDLVSDHRSVTPTAAAQWVTLDQYEVVSNLHMKQEQMTQRMTALFTKEENRLNYLLSNPFLQDPKTWIFEKRMRLDSIQAQFDKHKNNLLNQKMDVDQAKNALIHAFQNALTNQGHAVQSSHQNLLHSMDLYTMNIKKHLKENESLLDAYSPLKVLTRGYSISKSSNHILRSIDDVKEDSLLETRVSDGIITSKVIKKEKYHAE